MESQQLQLHDKVKLKLVQPQIKCDGRDDVTCYYRGKIVGLLGDGNLLISFKYKQTMVTDEYDIELNCFINYPDITIV